MDAAQELLDELLSWVQLQKKGAAKLKELATEMEEMREKVNVTKVVGSSASVGGAAALTAAGVLTLFTGGLAAPLLAVGAAATGLGFATNVGADIVDVVKSNSTMEEAKKISEKIERAEEKIQRLKKKLKDEQQKYDELPADNYVMERILRAMARNQGLILPPDVSLWKILFSSRMYEFDDISGLIVSFCLGLGLQVVLKAAKQTGKAAAVQLSKQAGQMAAKAVGRIAGGAIGLLLSIPELVSNCKNLDNCETEASRSLRKNAEAAEKASDELKKKHDEIKKLIERLARLKLSIETRGRSQAQMNELLEFAIQICGAETIRQWLRENASLFFRLIDLFNPVREEILRRKKEEKIDIIFVAHGSIRDHMEPASCLLPLPSIEDVLLYSPWNCAINAEAAYGIATGLIQHYHRVFRCSNQWQCRVPDEAHCPRKLPYVWNSMRTAGAQLIPWIIVQSLKWPTDPAWEAYIDLSQVHGPPDRSRIVIPFIFPGHPVEVPFYIIMLVCSVVLYFTAYKATVHLAACLGDVSRNKFDGWLLENQYSYTIDNSLMSTSNNMFPIHYPELYRAFQALFA